MLGDQPGVTRGDGRRAARRRAATRRSRSAATTTAAGHPIAFGAGVFAALAGLHGDKGVWRLLDQRGGDVVEVPIAGPVPRDVDTAEDYEAVLAGRPAG